MALSWASLGNFAQADGAGIVSASSNSCLAIKRQKGSRFLKLTSWAIYYRAEFRHLIDDITSLIDNIEKLFPEPQARIALARQEVVEFGNKESVELVENAVKGMDSLLQTAAQEVFTEHQYLNVVIRGQAQTVRNGKQHDVGDAVDRFVDAVNRRFSGSPLLNHNHPRVYEFRRHRMTV